MKLHEHKLSLVNYKRLKPNKSSIDSVLNINKHKMWISKIEHEFKSGQTVLWGTARALDYTNFIEIIRILK